MGWTLGILAVGFGDIWYQKIVHSDINASVPVLFIGQAVAGALLLILTNINPGLGIAFTILTALTIFYRYGI